MANPSMASVDGILMRLHWGIRRNLLEFIRFELGTYLIVNKWKNTRHITNCNGNGQRCVIQAVKSVDLKKKKFIDTTCKQIVVS